MIHHWVFLIKSLTLAPRRAPGVHPQNVLDSKVQLEPKGVKLVHISQMFPHGCERHGTAVSSFELPKVFSLPSSPVAAPSLRKGYVYLGMLRLAPYATAFTSRWADWSWVNGPRPNDGLDGLSLDANERAKAAPKEELDRSKSDGSWRTFDSTQW